MSDEELAEFLSERTTCELCKVNCEDKQYCPSMSSCLFKHLEWLQKEVEKMENVKEVVELIEQIKEDYSPVPELSTEECVKEVLDRIISLIQ